MHSLSIKIDDINFQFFYMYKLLYVYFIKYYIPEYINLSIYWIFFIQRTVKL